MFSCTLLDEQGEIVAQSDRKPVDGLAATDTWQPGDIIRDPLSMPLPARASGWIICIAAGSLFERETGQRLPVEVHQCAAMPCCWKLLICLNWLTLGRDLDPRRTLLAVGLEFLACFD